MVAGGRADEALAMPDPLRCRSPSVPVVREIEALYRGRFGAFHRVASAIAGDAEGGLDAVQEGFARAVRRHRDFRGDGSLEGWLWRTVVNAARDQRRARGRVTLTDAVPERADHRDEVLSDIAEELRERIVGLPERQRHALFLRYFVDLTYAEIGEALGIQVGTVGATLNAAHRALRIASPRPRTHELVA
jgi:RNA polymerase sigma factor (sigma-70 family)